MHFGGASNPGAGGQQLVILLTAVLYPVDIDGQIGNARPRRCGVGAADDNGRGFRPRTVGVVPMPLMGCRMFRTLAGRLGSRHRRLDHGQAGQHPQSQPCRTGDIPDAIR